MHLHPEWFWPTLWLDWALPWKQLINQKKWSRICWCGCAVRFECVRLWPPQWGNRKILQLPEMQPWFVHAGKGKAKGIVKPGICCSRINAERFCFSQGWRDRSFRSDGGMWLLQIQLFPPYTALQYFITVLWTPVCAKCSLVLCCKISLGVAFDTATRCIWGTLDTLNGKNILKIASSGTHGPF